MTNAPGCWWTISEENLLQMLHEVAAGATPDSVYAEHYANGDHEHDQW